MRNSIMPPSRRRFLDISLSIGLAALGKPPFAIASPVTLDWPEVSTSGQAHARALEDLLVSAGKVRGLQSIIVVQDGRLAAERYYEDTTKSDLFELYSVTKSVGSMLIGIAIHQGRLKGVNETLGEILLPSLTKMPDATPNSVTLAQILTHTSGLTHEPKLAWQKRTIRSAALQRWYYNNAAVDILSDVIAQAAGMPIAEFASRELFAPLGITQFKWPVDRYSDVQVHQGLKLRARDMAKLAWVMTDNGQWSGQQILPAAWVTQSTHSHVIPTWPLPMPRNVGYGYLWFCGAIRRVPVKWAWGRGGQLAMLVPSRRLAITMTTNPLKPDDKALSLQQMRLAARIIEIRS